MKENLEQTGHSYSGIADIVSNSPEKLKSLLSELTDFYDECVVAQEKAERQLDIAKNNRALAVSDYFYLLKALDKKEITYKIDDEIITVSLFDYENRLINIDKKKLTELPS